MFRWASFFGLRFACLIAAACVSTDPIDDGDGGSSDGTGGRGSPDGGAGGSTSNSGGFGGSTSTGGVCEDGVCDGGETCQSCPFDCPCDSICGDEACDPDETCETCPDDCGACETCGDGTCNQATENCETCQQDCGVCTCQPDNNELNNSSGTATKINFGVDYCGLSICAGDVDWFEVNMTNGFTATVTFTHAEGDLEVEIYDGQTLDYVSGSYSGDNDEVVVVNGVPTGRYWIRVFGSTQTTENFDYCVRAD